MSEWQITFWDVGQGDATDIQLPDKSHILIDSGPLSSRQNPLPAWFADPEIGRPRIRSLILTHSHRDHFGGAVTLCSDERQWIDSVILPFDKSVKKLQDVKMDDEADRLLFTRFMAIVRSRKGTTAEYISSRGTIYESDGLRLKIIYPLKISTEKPLSGNLSGLVIVLESIETAERPLIVWSGDTLLRNVVDNVPNGINGILMGPHHGKPQDSTPEEPDEKTGYFTSLCKRLSPEVLFVSVGRENPYDHPYRRYLISAAQAGVSVCCSELSKRCKEKCDGHVYQGSMMLGLQPPKGAMQCRGAMRVFVSAKGGLRFDQCQAEFLKSVKTSVPDGYCQRTLEHSQRR